ncbi:MAG: hypothetical protein K8S55_06970 [Phycisphaerae bacterium]|nr:hypothetical protein [Phycisphaerae bacterium]
MNKQSKPRVGVVGLTLELYETLAPDLRPQREQWVKQSLLPALEPIADVQFERAVYTPEDIDDVIARYEAADLDALLVICLTYSPSQISLPAFKRTRLPIVVWNTQELFVADDSFGSAEMRNNHGVHGTQDLCNVLLRSGVKFEYVTSHIQDNEALGELEDFFVSAAAVNGLRRARLGLIGYPFPGMGDFAHDSTHLAATLGCRWQSISVEQYIKRSESADAESVANLIAEYREKYDLADDLTETDLEATARAELSLRAIVKDNRLDAFSYQFMAFGEDERTVTLPFVAASRLMGEGIGFAGEGDLVGAAGSWLLNRLKSPASFSEIFTVDFGNNGVIMSHMGEASVAMARTDGKIRMIARAAKITPTRERQLALVTNFQPGPATLFALSLGANQKWRFIVSQMRIDDFGPLPSMETPHFRLVPESGDVRDFLTAYAKVGGPHHNAVCFGDARSRLKSAADLLDADYIEV